MNDSHIPYSNSQKLIRTRFAPSPTGFMHVGGVRTALFAWLFARHSGGQFILRIEDTDQLREVKGSVAHIQESLKWLGINWDEGPFYQSERLDTYKKYALKLVSEGRAYADPYSPEQIEKFREQAKIKKEAFLYRNHRPNLEEIPAWDGSRPLRLKSNSTSCNIYPPEAIDDFILIKSDGFPTYNFAHVIDDHEMEISDVIRGQEFLASMPKYYDLYISLGFDTPRMWTLPHVLAENGTKKLGKRDGAKDILSYRDEGYLPEAMINFLATLGWNDGTEQEIFSRSELIEKFSLDRVQKSPARFDEKRLLWLNGQWIRRLSLEELYQRTNDFWPESSNQASGETKKQILALVQDRLKTLADLPLLTSYFFDNPTPDWNMISSDKILSKLPCDEIIALLKSARDALLDSKYDAKSIQQTLNSLLETTGQKPGVLFSIIRLAVSWAPFSPALNETLAILGPDKVHLRLQSAIDTAK